MKQDKAAVLRSIERGFARTQRPDDSLLVGSHEGCEPEDVVGPFRVHKDWRGLDPTFLDASYTVFKTQIQMALDAFWLDRAAHAPTADEIQAHLDAEAKYAAYLERKYRSG